MVKIPITVTHFKVRWSDGKVDEVYIETTVPRKYKVVGLSNGDIDFENEYDTREDALGDINCLWWEYWEHLLDVDSPGELLEFNRERIPVKWSKEWTRGLGSIFERLSKEMGCKIRPLKGFVHQYRRRV